MHYNLTQSNRKTIAIYIRNGIVEVKAPLKTPKSEIDRFVKSKSNWIEKNLAVSSELKEQRSNFTLEYNDMVLYRGSEYPIIAIPSKRVGFDDEQKHFYVPQNLNSEQIKYACVQVYKMLAKRDLSEKVLHFSKIMKLIPSDVKVNSAKTRWGSCSGRRSLNFSWRLIMADDDVVDYVVVHELAHIKEMNHSARFWAIVESVLSDYRERQARLKELQKRLNMENWDYNPDNDYHESESENKNPRWHYADYKTILSPKNGMNLYRGCTHNCIYCDSRSDCYQMKHDFEDIEVKRNAVQILEQQLRRKREPCMIGTGAMCDPYIHLEEELQITRQCLELIEKYGFGVALLTKSARVMRDIALLCSINAKAKCVVQITMTTFDEDLCRMIEPDVSTTAERFETLKALQKAGIPTVVWLCPILPFINDTEENLRGILDYCIKAGVRGIVSFGFGTTVREGSREYFYAKLDELSLKSSKFSGVKQKYIETFGNNYICNSPNDSRLQSVLRDVCSRNGIMYKAKDVFDYMYKFEPKTTQLSLWD